MKTILLVYALLIVCGLLAFAIANHPFVAVVLGLALNVAAPIAYFKWRAKCEARGERLSDPMPGAGGFGS